MRVHVLFLLAVILAATSGCKREAATKKQQKVAVPEQVVTYVKDLIDTVGQDGGYALATGAVLDHATVDNLHAMFKTCKEYGVYS